MSKRFSSPIYNVTTSGGEKVAIDVTNSISAGLEPSAFQTRYHSLDGLALRYGCYEHGSPAEAKLSFKKKWG